MGKCLVKMKAAFLASAPCAVHGAEQLFITSAAAIRELRRLLRGVAKPETN
jgi:hypothetical protein